MPTRRDVLSSGAHACTAALAAAALPLPGFGGSDQQRFMLIGLSGAGDPSRASLLLVWAHLLAEAGHTVRVDLAGDGVALVRRAVADSVQAPGLPPFTDILEKSETRGIPIYVCRPCAAARGVTDADLEGRNIQYTNGEAMAAAMTWATRVVVV